MVATTTTNTTPASKPSPSAPPGAQAAVPPSGAVEPNRMPAESQHGRVQTTFSDPDGVLSEAAAAEPSSPTTSSGRVAWKDQVIAFAKKTRGTLLRKPTLKEHGDQILAGQANAQEPTRKG
ncbi:hypothetical protein BC827DRAFT_1268558 [Russula dissimulans]|nr:hypothetical protein BC827DRAFT_1268558 [Russula dissimulans]